MDMNEFESYIYRTHPILSNVNSQLTHEHTVVIMKILKEIEALPIKPFRKFNVLKRWYFDFREMFERLPPKQGKDLEVSIQKRFAADWGFELASEYEDYPDVYDQKDICESFYTVLRNCIRAYFHSEMSCFPHPDEFAIGHVLTYERTYDISRFLKTLFNDKYFDMLDIPQSLFGSAFVYVDLPSSLGLWLYFVNGVNDPHSHYKVNWEYFQYFHKYRSKVPCAYYAQAMRALNHDNTKYFSRVVLESFNTPKKIEQAILEQEIDRLKQEQEKIQEAISSLIELFIDHDGWKPLPLMILDSFLAEDIKVQLFRR